MTLFKDLMEIGTAILMSTGLALALYRCAVVGRAPMSLDQYLFVLPQPLRDEQVIALFVIAFVVLVLTALFFAVLCILTLMKIRPFVDGRPVMSILFNVVTGLLSPNDSCIGSLLVSGPSWSYLAGVLPGN